MTETDSEEDSEFAKDKFELMKKFVAQISEHFENVQLFCSIGRGDEGTFSAQFGAGNYYARHGQCRDWVLKNDERSRVEVRQEGD